MTPTLAQKMFRGLRWLLAIGALSVIVVQITYLYKFVFVPGNWFTFSDDPAVWGQYGAFVGGVLNPIFSFLAFSGLAVTIILQARQMDDGKRYAEIEEMQRVQATIADRIERLLAAKFICVAFNRRPDTSQTVFEVISALGTFVLSEPDKDDPKWKQWDLEKVGWSDVRKDLETQTVALRLEFESLSFMLIRYQDHHGSEDVMDFYKYRFGATLVWLDALGLLKSHGLVLRFFNPQELMPHMQPVL